MYENRETQTNVRSAIPRSFFHRERRSEITSLRPRERYSVREREREREISEIGGEGRMRKPQAKMGVRGRIKIQKKKIEKKK